MVKKEGGKKNQTNKKTVQGFAKSPAELLIMKKRPVLSKYKGMHRSFGEITIVNEPPYSTAVSKLLWGSWKARRWVYLLTHNFLSEDSQGNPSSLHQDKVMGKNWRISCDLLQLFIK